jgi:hypothetical protein
VINNRYSIIEVKSTGMSKNFKTIMIRVKGDPVSEAYAAYCAKSWEGFGLRFYDAVTPDTLDQQSGIKWGKRYDGNEPSPTEKSVYYSQYNLWKKCYEERKPILILEHDAWLEDPSRIHFNEHLDVQYFGQHAMEAIMLHPRFAQVLMRYHSRKEVSGPMNTFDVLLGYKALQSRVGRPHARYLGPMAPVKHVIDPNLGTSVKHPEGRTTVNRLSEGDADLFKIIDLRKELNV